jgi:hypothetical protein
MQRIRWFWAGAVLLTCGSAAWADLATEFAGYTRVRENTVSGLKSSVTTSLPTSMFTLGPDRVSYPSGIGAVPSPGYYNWAEARPFDEGGLGIRIAGGNLTVRAASGLNPQTGYWGASWQRYYSVGDVFLTVDDSDLGVKNFALLGSWARNPASGAVLSLGTSYDAAQSFHVGGREGHLVQLSAGSQVGLTGGPGTYAAWTPSGLDSRVYAQGGLDLGDALLAHSQTTDIGLHGVTDQTFYLQTWTVPLSWLSGDPSFGLGLHQATSCGNDQIGMVTHAPLPGAVVLGMLGLSCAGWRLRRGTA